MSRRSSGLARVADAAPIFAALGDETRLALLARLGASGPVSIAKLTGGSAVSRQAITKHLGVLASAGLVQSTRVGRERIWEFDEKPLQDARRFLDEISSQWDEALGRLRRMVEDGD